MADNRHYVATDGPVPVPTPECVCSVETGTVCLMHKREQDPASEHYNPKTGKPALQSRDTPTRQVFDVVYARWHNAVQEDSYNFVDVDCIADQLMWREDIVDDAVADLLHDGFIVELADGLLVPTMDGHRAIERWNKKVSNG